MAPDLVTARESGPVLRGTRVLVRPFRQDEVEVLERGMAGAQERELPMGVPPREELRRRVLAGGRMQDGMIELAVEADGRVVGQVQAFRALRFQPPGVFTIGIGLFDSADRGRGLGREAVALMTAHMFEAYEASRIEVPTDVENSPMRAVAERLGFTLEGVLRAYMPSSRGRRDYAMYAMTRDDWEKQKDAWTSRS